MAHTTGAINLQTIDFLLSEQGRQAAAALADLPLEDAQIPARLAELRRRFAPAEAGALLALARLRRQAAAKFPEADRLFFSAEALEQATARPIAERRAAWIDRHASPGPLLDLGCGLGGDTLALARLRPVIAYELDPLRLRLAQANAAALGLADRVTFIQADWTTALAAGQLPAAAAAFADPARRQMGRGGESRRIFRLTEIQPPLPWLLRLQAVIPALGVKVMPGVDADEIPSGCGVEFISHAGVCKEAVLWFGPLAGPGRRASVHHAGQWHMLAGQGAPPPLGPLAPGMVLYEPDPAVIRAGAFAELCAALDAHLFDPEIAYLVAREARPTPFAQPFRILEIHPFSLNRLQARLAALNIGRVELKKRGAPFAPESLRGRLKLSPAGRPGVVLFTRHGDARVMILAERD